MKLERFRRTKSVVASSAIALVVAALVVGISSLVVGPRSASPQHVGFALTSSPSTFTITSNVYPSPGCTSPPASLYPGTTRCAVFTVKNLLNVPITVQSITTALDASYPAPPTECAPPTYFTLPTFSGSATVGANATVNLPGVPIQLIDSGSDQSVCENYTYHFVYSGGAQLIDSTTTSLASNQNPSTSGQSVTFTATVAASNPGTDGSSPTSGTVTFYSCPTAACASTTQLGTGNVGSNSQATYSTATLPVGTNYIEAVYGGSGTNFTGGTSNVVTQTVNSGSISTTSVLTSAPNPSTYGSSVTFSDTVSASSGMPGGSVTFYNCGSSSNCSTKSAFASGTVTLNSSGKASFSTSALPVGTTYVEVVYPATGNYGGSTSNVVAQVVNALGTTSVLTSAPNPSTYGSSVTFSDTVSASSGTPGGSVTFYNCGSSSNCSTKSAFASGTVTLNSSGKASFSTSALPVGTTYVEVVYPATGNYGGSTSNVVAQVVNALGTTSVLTSAPNPSTYGSSVTFSDTVSASSGMPGGSVTFYNCGSSSNCSTKSAFASGTVTLNSSGKASFSTSALPVGTTYVEVVYPATGNYGGSTSNVVAQVVNALGTTSVLTSAPNPSTYGSSVTFSDTVSASSGTPGGSVTFYNCGSSSNCSTKSAFASGTVTLNSSGRATFSTSALPVGTTYVEAVYSATGNYGGSTSNVVTQVVNTLGTTSVLTSAPNPSTYGSSVTFSDTVSASSGTPGGSVTFYNCGSSSNCSTKSAFASGTVTLNSSGRATFSTSALPVGTTYVEAVYPATGNYGGSTSNVVAQVVNTLGTTSVLTSAPNPSTYGSSVAFSDTVSASSGTPGGPVTFYNCGSSSNCSTKSAFASGTVTLNSSGKASFSTSALPVGTTYVEAVYPATGNYGGSTSNVVAQVVNTLGTTSVLTSAPNPSTYGSSVAFSDTVSASSGTPGGPVTFYNCGSSSNCSTKSAFASGTVTLNSSGKASFSTSALPVGTTYVEAVYPATGNYGGSTSNVVAQVVLNVPSVCAPGGYSDVIVGTPADPVIYGTNGNDLIYAFGSNYLINGFAGNDCIDAGDGNNVIFDGNGNDGVVAGNGNNLITVGNGTDSLSVGNRTNQIIAGNGTDTVSVGNGSQNQILVGNGTDSISVGTGTYNTITLGSGADTVTAASPTPLTPIHDTIYGGPGNETIYLGAGSYNTYYGVSGRANTCHLPKPPSSWHGTVAGYYNDTITNCTVVTP